MTTALAAAGFFLTIAATLTFTTWAERWLTPGVAVAPLAPIAGTRKRTLNGSEPLGE